MLSQQQLELVLTNIKSSKILKVNEKFFCKNWWGTAEIVGGKELPEKFIRKGGPRKGEACYQVKFLVLDGDKERTSDNFYLGQDEYSGPSISDQRGGSGEYLISEDGYGGFGWADY